MEIDEIRNLVNHYEDKIITNFDENFSRLVLMDFYEGGYEERIEDEFYYEEYFSRYEQGVINLLLEIENCFDDECESMKLRLIRMKRKIDTSLSKLQKSKDEELSFRFKRKSQFLLNSNIPKGYFIECLYKKLLENKLISDDFKNFEQHFNIDWEYKIQWLGTELQLSNLIYLLIEEKYLDPETKTFRHKLVCAHFINKKGNEFQEKQLSSVFAEKRDTIPNDDVIYKIIYELSTDENLN